MELTLDKPKNFNVLLVEDNPGDARLVQEMLKDAAGSSTFDVHHVERLAEARQRVMQKGPGCVLLDLTLPDARRLEALMQLRAAAPDVPIVILSGLQDELLAVKAVQEGAQDYLLKTNVTADQLGRSINYAVERKQQQRKLMHRAMHDPLTGLPNRELFFDRLTHAIAWSKRHGSTFAILFIDLDGFKTINDSQGHDRGDRVLVEIGQRLKNGLRQSDTAARFGGDEFVLLCEDLSDEQQATKIAERVHHDIEDHPVEGDGDRTWVKASIGVVVKQQTDSEPEVLIREADAAMYRAKREGKPYELFDSALQARVTKRRDLEAELREAIRREQFRVLYQPQVDLRTGEIRGVEALVRWDHPTRGLLPPAEFIWLAEETGLIIPIGAWVLREALEQGQRWREARGTSLQISVNLSTRQHEDVDLVQTVADALENTETDPQHLCLEITETTVIRNVESTLATLAALKDLGTTLSIDDFGTGYSSLSSLKKLPVDSLKVDRSFVSGLANGHAAEDSAIVTAVVTLAHSLGMTAIAEGIESPGQLERLKEIECDLGQGFYFARPRPPAVIGELIGAH